MSIEYAKDSGVAVNEIEAVMSSKDSSESLWQHDDMCNLHDCLSLGAFEYGLPYLKIRPAETNPDGGRLNSLVVRTEDDAVHTDSLAEIHRLPLLLRLLSQSRPLSSVQSLEEVLRIQEDDSSRNEDMVASNSEDPLLDDVVARLEDRAALYAAVERVQMVSCHLAPAACHRLSKLSPLSKRNRREHAASSNANTNNVYDTTELEVVAQDIMHSSVVGSKKQRRSSLTKQYPSTNEDFEDQCEEYDFRDDDDDLHGRRIEEPDDSEHNLKAEAIASTSIVNKKRKRSRPGMSTQALSISSVSEDSPEYNVLKTLHELISLTIASLKQDDGNDKMVEKEDIKNERTAMVQTNDTFLPPNCGSLPLSKMDDSILAQPARRAKSVETSSSVGGTIGLMSSFVDLSSTVVALMHHAPVLQHRHVASALCRAAFPQTSVLIARMGENCSAAVPSLLDGCITVYSRAVDDTFIFENSSAGDSSQIYSIVSTCVQSVRLLAELSPREASRVLSVLRRRNVMVELQFQLLMQIDALAAFMHISQNLHMSLKASNTPDVEPSMHPITSLCSHFRCNVSLLREALNFLNYHLSAKSIPMAQLSIILSAYIRIIMYVPMTQLLVNDGLGIVLRSREVIREKLELLRARMSQSPQQPKILSFSQEYNLLVAAMVSTYTLLVFENDFHESDCGAQFADMLCVDNAPNGSRHLMVRLSLSLFQGDEQSLYDIIGSSFAFVIAGNSTSFLSQKSNHFLSLLKHLCTWAASSSPLNLDYIEKGLSANGSLTLMSPSVVLHLMKHEHFAHSAATMLLQRVLMDSEAVETFILDPLTVDIIERGIAISLQKYLTKLPIVTPLQIQALASAIPLWQWENLEIRSLQFLLQLLYCFYFYELEPKSPFRIDPRELPLNRVLEIGERFKNSSRIDSGILLKLNYFIDTFCPEVRRFYRFKMLKSRKRLLQQGRRMLLVKENKQEFIRILRQAVTAEPQSDVAGLLAEQAFIEASYFLSDADLISSSISALLSSPSSLPLFFTYPMLYRDPLVALKCPLAVWIRRGTRRVVLAVLSSLLVTNDNIVRKDGVCQEVANELLSSRNEILLRCLLRVVTSPSSKVDGSSLICFQTYSRVRILVASHEGLTALLLKQGLSESEMDWLTEFVPEAALDFSMILGMLSDKSSLSAAKRLVVADCSLRLSIAYGHRSDGCAEAIARACLSQLLSSFFLILGPVGVPVNALMGHGTDLDATQVARKAAFRLLSSLQKIRMFRKAETLSILQKFLGMCKGESIVGSLQTSISGSQKSLLKDLVEIVRKSMESMGFASNTQE